MFGFPPEIVAGMAAALLTGGTVKGITGIGLPVVTMVIVVNFVSPQTALALITISIVVTNGWQAIRAGDVLSPLKRFWPTVICFIVCLYIGSRIIAHISAEAMLMLIGIAVVIFTTSQLWKPRQAPLSPTAERVLGPIAGTLGGLLGGISTIWGPPLMMYLFMLHLPKDEWVKCVAAIWLIGAIPLTAFYFNNGVLNGDTVWLSIAACIPGMIGILIGERIRARIDEVRFRKVLLIALLLVGLNLIRRAVF